ncbi:ectoine/hydroxyectoine ABC transporter substrate-binding protein EhuB [Allonocardiopsis opalescens]|uniref:Amino acid ABC transporter substrate-binding protein (PAAT family) n=1 Tax=Allonocardiopsis opalescens TaxID=1144618 RepID=A0A2T0Q9N0_9ACTN|nr:ectoine/hydroxyectoine ABC transporter substrate-binding protein EhuB [Allonocardiopsis opalescens]PRY00547.1 amino acid ABC transporter substrate-binding protein (PAAT family) [Allonocardiopsis opalescens]
MTHPQWRRRDLLLRMAGLGAAAVAGPALLSACTPTDPGTGQTEGGTLQRLRDQGFVNVGFANEAPYGYTDSSGNLTGESPELARVIFAALGIPEVRGTQVEFAGLIAGLGSQQFDLVAAGMAITPERCEQVAFTNPEYLAPTAFMVPEGNPENIVAFEDVADNPDLRLGVLTGAVEEGYATTLGVAENQITPLADQPTAFESLVAGRIDAIALTSISLNYLLSQNEGEPFEVTEPFFPVINGEEIIGGGGFALRQSDQDLVEAMNAELETLKQNNELLPILEPFGFTEAELPGDYTAQQLCQGG